MPTLRTITLNRTGIIQVRVVGANHCGAPSAVKPFDEANPALGGVVDVKYTVRLVVGAYRGLDSRGFLVDQEALHTLMVNIGQDPVPWHEPCELLTEVWGNRLLTWVYDTNLDCTIHELDLTLSPMPHLGAFTSSFRSN